MVKKVEEKTTFEEARVLQTMWPTVDKFARKMRQKLEENEAEKGGDGTWLGSSLVGLMEHLKEEVEELERIIDQRNNIPMHFKTSQALHEEMTKEIVREAADVGNMAMMIADVVGGLGE